MKTVYLIHGWGRSSEEGWFVWLKEELAKKKIKVYAFDMPETNNPKIEAWVKFMEEKIKDANEETYFVGHSIGCQTIMRFLEKLPKNKTIGGCCFIAEWFDLVNLTKEEIAIAHPWINTKIDFERIRRHTDNFLCIFSDNDDWVDSSEHNLFKEKFGAKIIVKKKMGHFEDIKKIPEVLDFLVK